MVTDVPDHHIRMVRFHYQGLNIKGVFMGFGGLLTIIFVIFKILGYLDWSWWLVFLPYIIQLLLVASVKTLDDNRKNRGY